MGYCKPEDVGAMLLLTFTEISIPTSIQVQKFIDMISAELSVFLSAKRISEPSVGSNLYRVLSMRCAQGVAGLIALSFFTNAESVQNTLGSKYMTLYEGFLEDLTSNPSKYNALMGVGIENAVTNGTVDEDDIPMIEDNWVE